MWGMSLIGIIGIAVLVLARYCSYGVHCTRGRNPSGVPSSHSMSLACFRHSLGRC